ncbi:hypothetical protein GH714_017792 [Hevea brasiliensis]|uniref:Uncharacterized protein n=1 Tax=Hevea brasiliensis TaxID=3981 RepID=A0A6A6N1T9_HEVBR|nr:hypothetical protein GH714_017792 [Hevea brasiliensis]
MLEDAEEKQMSNRSLKGETEAGSSKLRKLVHTVKNAINPGAVTFNSTMVSKMKEITTRFQKIVDQQNHLDLINRNVGGTSSSKVCVRPPSTCLDHEPEVYGRDEDKRKILDLISNTSEVKVGVIPIFGMGGVDDVWNKNYDEWNALCSPLMHGAPGSRVIVTTRDEAIARMMETIESHNLNCISDENCWKLFLYPLLVEELQIQNWKSSATRVLSFHGYNITELPDSIGALKHLRYLDLSCTRIVTLPERTTSLCNLQTMLLKGCNDLKKLPSEMQNLINLRHLDIRWTSVEVMPQGMEKLRSLRTLSDFVVGEGNEVGITALENLKFLRGALRISRLDNVANASNVSGTILLDKGRIDDLEMACGTSYLASRSVSIANEERVVLEKMKPHESLEKLTIIDYGGIQFPSWVGDPLFRNLVCLELKYCKCTTLPQLGLLSSLKDLVIIGFPNVKAVDCEFCGESMSSSNPFPALETLRFEDMKEWKEWNICGCEFRLLRKLSIVYCPELLGKLPSHLPSLQTLEIRECYGLVVSFQNLPSISHFQIQGCRKVELRGGFSAANFLMVSKVESFLFGSEELEQGLRKLKSLTVGNIPNYVRFIVGNNYFYPHSRPHWVLFEGIAKRGKLLRKGLADCQIKNLEFVCCKGLKKLPPWIDSFKSLRKLSIGNCPGLISLPDAVIYKSLCLEELKIDECEDLISIGRHQLPTTLKRLEICNCYGLQRLLDARETCSSSRFTDKEGISCDAYSSNLQHLGIIGCRSLTFLGELPVFDNNTSLESIEIKFAPHLKSLPENLHMLTNLRRIWIDYCEKLEALPDSMHNLTSLQELAIMNCPNVVFFPQGGLPTTHLKEIILESCGKLKALPDNMHNLTSLQELTIMKCPNVVSFPQGGLPTTHLKKIILKSCGKLKALPVNMHNLTSLEVLDMERCPGIMSFPEEGFPTNLKSLSIYEVEICTSLLNWGLHRLTSLEKLRIAGGCPGVVSFPQDEIDMKLSNSLTSLTIEGLQDLKYLSSKGFQSLTSLEYLVIKGCPKLASFPKNGLPSSL